MKKLLFIGPRFYNYHEIIKKGFEDANFEVDYYDDRPSTSIFSKVAIRHNKNLVKNKIKKYFEKILCETKDKQYDVVFVLYGQSFSKKMMQTLKDSQKQARFIFYMFDPLFSMPDRIEMKDIFDDCYSFDYEDCINHPEFKLVPLFYSNNEYVNEEIKYDACAIVTMMPGKYLKIKSMVEQLQNNNMSVYKMYYLQSKLALAYYKKKYKEFKGSKLKEFTFKRLTRNENDKILMQSKYILDCPKEGQSGLTIRTFEALLANKKFITTNRAIVKYDFYRPENIYVFDGEFDFNDIFFNSEYIPVSDEIKKQYSINSWVKKILKNFEMGE